MGMALTVEACSIKSNIRIQCHCQDSPRMTGLGLSIVTIMPSMEAPSRLWANHGAILRESMLGTISGMRIRSGTILVSRMPRSASEAIHATYTIYQRRGHLCHLLSCIARRHLAAHICPLLSVTCHIMYFKFIFLWFCVLIIWGYI